MKVLISSSKPNSESDKTYWKSALTNQTTILTIQIRIESIKCLLNCSLYIVIQESGDKSLDVIFSPFLAAHPTSLPPLPLVAITHLQECARRKHLSWEGRVRKNARAGFVFHRRCHATRKKSFRALCILGVPRMARRQCAKKGTPWQCRGPGTIGTKIRVFLEIDLIKELCGC